MTDQANTQREKPDDDTTMGLVKGLTLAGAAVLMLGVLVWPCTGVASGMNHRHDWQTPAVAETLMHVGMIAAVIHFIVLLAAAFLDRVHFTRTAAVLVCVTALASTITYVGLLRWGSAELDVKHPVHEIDRYATSGRREVMMAIAAGDETHVRQFVDSGGSLNFSGQLNRTNPLWVAYDAQNESMFQLLLELGADPAADYWYEYHTLVLVLRNGQSQWLKHMLDAGLNPNMTVGYNHEPLIIVAARSNRQSDAMLRLLVEHGAVVDVNVDGTSPLKAAVESDNWPGALYLLQFASAEDLTAVSQFIEERKTWPSHANRSSRQEREFMDALKKAIDEPAPSDGDQ